MKRFLKIILIIFVVIIAIAAALIAFLAWASKQPQVKENYYETVTSDRPLEQRYTQKGTYEVSYVQYKSATDHVGQIKIWYPTELESADTIYPLVVMANGTGVPASKYEPIFDHLASWGFVVVGNEDSSSWDGLSTSESLAFMLEQNADESSLFYERLDTGNIGVAGHSQGGVGALNAVTEYENGACYKTIYTASATHHELAVALGWDYDVSRIYIPYFMVAGTGQLDAGGGKGEQNAGIAPLWSLQENYEALPGDAVKVYARRTNTDHGEMLARADGYMTAWFLYQLKGDADAEKVFVGAEAEIADNANWQDVERNR